MLEMRWPSLCGMLVDVSKREIKWTDDSARQHPVQDRMDLARDHRLGHPRLRPYRHADPDFERPAIPPSDRRGFHRDGVVRPPDHHVCLQTPRTVGLVRLVVLPGVLDGAPRGRIAARNRARPPGCVHRSLACGSATPRARVLPAKGSTGAHDLVKVPIAAYFRE